MVNKKLAILNINQDLADKFLALIDCGYNIEITSPKEADYILHSLDGYDFLKYDAVKIFLTGEYFPPNFLFSDYAIGFDKIEFGDRYLQFPLLRLDKKRFDGISSFRQGLDVSKALNRDFCTYVMSNVSNSSFEREEIFHELNAYKPVHSGGKWKNNVGGPVQDKFDFISKSKFNIAFENLAQPGYLTEKLLDAFSVNTIPIYWGDETVSKLFNPEAFINCHDYPDMKSVAEEVARINEDDDLYIHMISQSIFIDGVEPELFRVERLNEFMRKIFSKEITDAKYTEKGRWQIKKNKEANLMSNYPLRYLSRKLSRSFRIWRRGVVGRG